MEKELRKFHRKNNKHTLIVEITGSYEAILRVLKISESLRKARNILVGIMSKKYNQLVRDKKFKKIINLYRKEKSKEEPNKKILAKYGEQLNNIQAKYDVTEFFCTKEMIKIKDRLKIHSVFGLTKSEDVWSGIEKCLYSNGEKLHFHKHGILESIRAKQLDKGIILKEKKDSIFVKVGKDSFDLIIKDRFQREELDKILYYLRHSNEIEEQSFLDWKSNIKTDTFRPCFCTIVPQKIRGEERLFLHITIDGKALPKHDKNGNKKHKLGTGQIGVDIGTQSFAFTSETEVGIKNLSELGQSIKDTEQKKSRIQRALDRSRRANNPDNYNKDGTIKKGKKNWVQSNRYKKKREKYMDVCRKAAVNRELAINKDVNMLRKLGNVVITEPKNSSKLAKKTKKSTKKENGKYTKRKRFGKSIQNRCPGKFQEKLERKFKISNGVYIETSKDYRASQYDHTSDDYVKKKLSDRMFALKDGSTVQRDWYSSFLLYCCNTVTRTIDKNKCKKEFKQQLEKEKCFIEQVRKSRTKIFNSGIKF